MIRKVNRNLPSPTKPLNILLQKTLINKLNMFNSYSENLNLDFQLYMKMYPKTNLSAHQYIYVDSILFSQ